MRVIALILFSYFSTLSAQEGVTKLTSCLALEEERYHRQKADSPEVVVTKELLELFATIKELKLRDDLFAGVCGSRVKHKGMQLLRSILSYRKEAFVSTTEDFIYRGFQDRFLDELIRTSGQLFFNYIAAIQGQMPIADCLRDEIPQLKAIQERFKVLEGDVNFDYLLKKNEATQIFRQLKNLSSIRKRCEIKKQIQERKDRANSESE